MDRLSSTCRNGATRTKDQRMTSKIEKPFTFNPINMTCGDATVWIRCSGKAPHASRILGEVTVGEWTWHKVAVHSFTSYRNGFKYSTATGSSWRHADSFCGLERSAA